MRRTSQMSLNSQAALAHGDTYESAATNGNEAIRLWIDTAKEFGDPIPEPKGRRLMLA